MAALFLMSCPFAICGEDKNALICYHICEVIHMDMIKIGKFLSQLRKEQELTQEQLGEKLGVTNKTISRWENGNYLPPVEMLMSLSELYGVSINELLSGERLTAEEYRERAEENIKSALDFSPFTLEEKIDFYKKKWLKDHLFENVLLGIVWLCILLVSSIKEEFLLMGISTIVYVVVSARRRNEMMIYVEARAYDPPIGSDR